MGAAASTVDIDECRALTGSRFNEKVYQCYADKGTKLLSAETLQRLEAIEYDVYLTHDSDTFDVSAPNDSKISRVLEGLKQKNIKTWFDGEHKEPDIATKINKSQVAIVFMTEIYQNGINHENDENKCKIEYNLISKSMSEDRIIPVILDAAMRDNKSWSSPYMDFVDESNHSQFLDILLLSLHKMIIPISEWKNNEEKEQLKHNNQEIEIETEKNSLSFDEITRREREIISRASLPPTKNYSGKYNKLEGHNEAVISVTIAENGDIFSGSEESIIRQYKKNEEKYDCVKTFTSHSDYISCIMLYSSDILISASADSTLKIWVISSGKLSTTLTGHTDGIRCAIILTNGSVLSGGNDAVIRQWDVKNDKLVNTISGATGYITCLVEVRESIVLAGEAGQGTIRVYNISTNQMLQELIGHEPHAW
eukprot:CAMPEP_0182418234 /NCGR_PEP_ID=MMETSP1167-20130531/2726_1 /TAXON_ID=2988 /ORGANISM="Mallomonas Sp, Strain CCMP3275" /LENGTH=423 /DNA_ID=CAMNT_0024592357 /DNA_START=10 /DNA_END=1278 /DNA_ORIENTATION=-